MNSRDSGGFDNVRKVRVHDLIVQEFEDEREGRVRENFDEPFLPVVGARGRPRIAFT